MESMKVYRRFCWLDRIVKVEERYVCTKFQTHFVDMLQMRSEKQRKATLYLQKKNDAHTPSQLLLKLYTFLHRSIRCHQFTRAAEPIFALAIGLSGKCSSSQCQQTSRSRSPCLASAPCCTQTWTSPRPQRACPSVGRLAESCRGRRRGQ